MTVATRTPYKTRLSLPPFALVAAAALSACTPPPEPAKPPPPAPKPVPPPPTATVAPAPPEDESPPPSGPARELSLPAPAWDELSNGLKVATIASHALPIVQIRVAVLAGSAADGDKPGLAALTADLMKEGGAGGMSGREVIERAESLGASLSVSTGFDRTVLGMGVTKDQMAEALDVLAAVAQKPQMSSSEFAKLRKRRADEAADRARTDGAWMGEMVLFKTLFAQPPGAPQHPYAAYDATAAELGKISAGDCRAFHKRFFVPKNTFVVVAGDVTQDEVKSGVEKAFGSASGNEAPALAYPAPAPLDHLQITVVDRVRSTQSDVFAGMLGPERTSPSWPAFTAASQILGGGVSGRLFLDVREKQSLAYSTETWQEELAHGPSIFVAYVGTQSNKTGVAAKALLDHVERLGTTEPAPQELATATRFLADVTAIRLETVGALANELVDARVLGLPDDYPARYRKQIREVTADAVAKAAAGVAHTARTSLVVAGDAKVVAPMLSHFGEVKVVDPAKGFAVRETLAKNAEAPLELPDEAGK